jgi:hypothetical protein
LVVVDNRVAQLRLGVDVEVSALVRVPTTADESEASAHCGAALASRNRVEPDCAGAPPRVHPVALGLADSVFATKGRCDTGTASDIAPDLRLCAHTDVVVVVTGLFAALDIGEVGVKVLAFLPRSSWAVAVASNAVHARGKALGRARLCWGHRVEHDGACADARGDCVAVISANHIVWSEERSDRLTSSSGDGPGGS